MAPPPFFAASWADWGDPQWTLVALARPAKVFVGQRDPADPSHFSFTGLMNDTPFTIDGWLQPDETVTMQLRPAAHVTPAPRPGTPRRTVGP